MNEIKVCCECGNYIVGKVMYGVEDYENRSPYCLTCWNESVEE